MRNFRETISQFRTVSFVLRFFLQNVTGRVFILLMNIYLEIKNKDLVCTVVQEGIQGLEALSL